MQVGLVTACYKPVLNGVTRMVDLYRQHLERSGHQVTIFTLGRPDPAGDDPRVIRSPGLPLGSTGYYAAAGYNKKTQAALRRMDILHAHHLFMSVELAGRYANSPIVYTNHTRYDLYMSAYTPLPSPAAVWLMRRLWPHMTRHCNAIIAPSSRLRDLIRHFGVTRPVTVIPNGIDLAPFHHPAAPRTKADLGIPAGACLLVFVGRLSAEKSVTGLLQAFTQAAEHQGNLHLLLVGSGPQAETLKKQAHAGGVAGRVHFLGPVPYAQVGNILAAGDAFVTASISEVHPLTVMEALAAGLPVIAIDSPGIDEVVVSGRNGILASDSTHLAEAITSLAANRQHMETMGAAGRADSQRFDIRHTVQQTVDLYEQLLAGANP